MQTRVRERRVSPLDSGVCYSGHIINRRRYAYCMTCCCIQELPLDLVLHTDAVLLINKTHLERGAPCGKRLVSQRRTRSRPAPPPPSAAAGVMMMMMLMVVQVVVMMPLVPPCLRCL
jgi:hypothetical protein